MSLDDLIEAYHADLLDQDTFRVILSKFPRTVLEEYMMLRLAADKDRRKDQERRRYAQVKP